MNRSSASHYTWGGICEGWRLLDGSDLAVIEERMPPGSAEVLHVHERARQLFYVLEGSLTISLGASEETLSTGDAFEIRPGSPHQVRNTGRDDARFLVVSAPSTRGDRQDLI